MSIFSAYTPDFIRRGNNTFFSGNLSTGTDLATNFDLVKCITKNKYTKLLWKCTERTFTKKEKYISKMYFRGIFKEH